MTAMTNSSVAVVYHSGFGHTGVQAAAVRDGAASVEGTTAHLIAVEDVDAHWEELDAADAIIFGSPTYMAGASAAFKAFLDSTSPRYGDQRWRDKLAAGFTNSAGMNGDKLATLQQFALFAMQHGMIWVGLGLPPGNHTSEGPPTTSTGWPASSARWLNPTPTKAPSWCRHASDRRTAEHLGRRVAELAGRLRVARAPLVDVQS